MGEEEEGGGGFSWDQVVQANTAEEPVLPQVMIWMHHQGFTTNIFLSDWSGLQC